MKAAYLAYWDVVDKAFADPSQPDGLERVATEPLLSFVRDDLAQRVADRTRLFTPPERTTSHRIDRVLIDGVTAAISDCFVDARVKYDATGAAVDDAIVSKTAEGTLSKIEGGWLVSDLAFTTKTDGAARCGG